MRELAIRPAGGNWRITGFQAALLTAALIHVLLMSLFSVQKRPLALPAPPPPLAVEIIEDKRHAVPAGQHTPALPPAPLPTVTPEQPVSVARPKEQATVAATPPPLRPTTPPAYAQDLKPARQLYASAVFSNPRNAVARTLLRNSIPEEQMIQICNTEAVEQVAADQPGSKPDIVVAYAKLDPKMSGNEVKADGAALRNRHRWFNLRYYCVVDLAAMAVRSFAYVLGSEISRSQWEELALPSQ